MSVASSSAPSGIVRRAAAPVELALARLRRRGGRFAVAAAGIAVAAAALAAVQATSLAAQDQSLGRAVTQIDDAYRGVTATWGGALGEGGAELARMDAVVRTELRGAAGTEPVAAMVLREWPFEGLPTTLAAIDGAERWVRLESGRLPGPCTPERCEVVQLAGAGPIPRVPGMNVVRVGEASMRSELPFGGLLARTSANAVVSRAARYHVPSNPPILLAEGTSALANAPAIAHIRRSYSWFVPLEPDTVHPWTVDRFLGGLARARSTLSAAEQPLEVRAPDTELREAASSASVGGRRLLLLGGVAVALVLAFLVVAASAARRDAEASRQRLTWAGARRWQLLALEAAETVPVALLGVALGWAGGLLLGALAADRLGAPAGEVVREVAVWPAVALAVAAALVLLAGLRAPALALGGRSLSLVDVAAVGALAAIAVGLARGSADVGALASGDGTGVFLLLLPGLAAFVVAVAVARALAPALRALERGARGAPVSLRLAALALARSPGRAAVVTAFLAVSVGLGLFALAYRATLVEGQRDAAAYAVPRDAVVREDLLNLVPVLAAAAPEEYERIGDATPVVRLSGSLPLARSQPVTVLGVPADEIAALDGWRDDFAEAPPGELAAAVAPSGDVSLRGVQLPAGAVTLTLPVSLRGEALELRAIVRTPRGDFVDVDLGTAPQGRSAATGEIPTEGRGGLVVSLAFGNANTGNTASANAGLGQQPDSRGQLELGPLRAGGRELAPSYADWRGVSGLQVRSAGRTARIDYFLTTDARARFRPRQPGEGEPLPAIVSPGLAAMAGRGGVLAVSSGRESISVRVAAVANRFPTASGDFVVADREALATAFATSAPGVGVTNEFWLDLGPGGERALAQAPFDQLAVETRAERLEALRSDPLARGALLTLVVAAAAALGLAVAGLVLSLATDLRDERGELFDLEAQGAPPSSLRRHLRLRTLLVAAFGILGGFVAGAILCALVVRLVRVTAEGGAPEPPIRLALPWPLALVALALVLATALALAAAITRRAIGSGTDARP